MTSRRGHSKSKAGCQSCKQKHIKCDESGPPCVNCHVRGLSCQYHPSTAANLNPPPSAEVTQSTTAPTSTIPTDSRLRELRLFHQWSTDIYRSFKLSSGDENFWQVIVPQLALEHEYLLNAIFATSSLRFATIATSSDSREFQLAALEYQNLAISAFQSGSPLPTPSNYQAIFAFAIIHVALGFSFPSYAPEVQIGASIIENLITTCRLLKGVVSIFTTSREWLIGGPLQPLLNRPELNPNVDVLSLELEAAMKELSNANDKGYQDLCSQTGTSPSTAVSYHEANLSAISELRKCFLLAQRGDLMVCMRWLGSLDQDFVAALERLEPVAMLITSHWALMLNEFSHDRWWARSSAKLLVTEISMSLRPRKPEWSTRISWVHQQIGLPSLM